MRGSQFEGLPRTEALLRLRDYERHKLKLKQANSYYAADQALQMDDLINNFQSKRSLRSTFDKQTSDEEMQNAH